MSTYRLFTVVVGLAGVFASAGCNGLMNMAAPGTFGGPCTSDPDCPSGAVCYNGTCIPDNGGACWLFKPDGTCPDGKACANGVCTLTSTTWCDCKPGEGCNEGQCVSSDNAGACSASFPNGYCVDDAVCVSGTCVVITQGNICTSSRPTGLCPSGAACKNGQCIPISEDPCTQTNPNGLCAAGAACTNGQCNVTLCSASNPNGACTSIGEVCQNGVCTQLPCSPQNLTGPCAQPNTFCSGSGTCIPKGTCETNSDCNYGDFCSQGGTCRTNGTCTNDNDCDQFSMCSNGNCVSNPNCIDNAHCPAGYHCIGAPTGTCQPQGECVSATDCQSDQYCSVSGQCVANGKCLSNADCSSDGSKKCGATGTCLGVNECAADGDCAFAERCNLTTKMCEAVESCYLNKEAGTDPDHKPSCPNPSGEGCCRDDDRVCSTTAAIPRCVTVGRCINDDDCASGHDGLVQCDTATNTCTKGTICSVDSQCGAGKLCSALGVCINGQRKIDCGTTADCSASGNGICTGYFKCSNSNNCGGTELQSEIVTPNMLILLDRSGSMGSNNILVPVTPKKTCTKDSNCSSGQKCDTSNQVCATVLGTRWQVASQAVNDVVAAHPTDIRWGLAMFAKPFAPYPTQPKNKCTRDSDCSSYGGACATDSGVCVVNGVCTPETTPDFITGSATSENISARLATISPSSPSSNTPTQLALQSIANNPGNFGLTDATRDNYILLVTDGEPNCSTKNTQGTISNCGNTTGNDTTTGKEATCAVNYELDQVRGLAQSVKTFVVGFSADLSSATDIQNLNCFAVHGGTCDDATITTATCAATSNRACYHAANDATALAAAFDNIASKTAGTACLQTLNPAPADASLLLVKVDGVEVLSNAPNGYVYNPANNQLTLQGQACTDVRDGSKKLQIIYGCPGGGS